MKINVTNPELHIVSDNGAKKVQITVTAEGEHAEALLDNAEYLMNSKELSMDMDRAYSRRSLNANAMFWALCQKLATVLEVSNDEIYLTLLSEYGSAHVVTCDVAAADDMESLLKDRYKWVVRLGNMQINGQESVQFFCYRGSHEYNTQEMSRLINGAISECKNLGIPTDAPEYVKQAIEEWGR